MPVTATTSAATEVNSRSAILQGSLTDLGGEASVSVYFEYGTTTAYGSTTDALTLSAIGDFSAKITDFDESTTYHFRAVASDGVTAYNGADQSLTTTACPFQLTGTPSLESIYWSWRGLLNVPIYTGLSIVLDIADNWGDSNFVRLRQVDFYYAGGKIAVAAADIDVAATTNAGGGRIVENAFDTSTNKTGGENYHGLSCTWLSVTNQRVICEFPEEITFDEIRINNSHESGAETDRGVKNVVIYTSPDALATFAYQEYEAEIPNNTKIFDGQFDQHVASDVEDEQILTLIMPE